MSKAFFSLPDALNPEPRFPHSPFSSWSMSSPFLRFILTSRRSLSYLHQHSFHLGWDPFMDVTALGLSAGGNPETDICASVPWCGP